MQEPIGVKIDPDVEAGYVWYRRLRLGERVARTQRVGDDLNVDYDDANDVLGIELLAFDDCALSEARAVAGEHGLDFPRDIPIRTVTDRRGA